MKGKSAKNGFTFQTFNRMNLLSFLMSEVVSKSDFNQQSI
jgi:hypothetical protein